MKAPLLNEDQRWLLKLQPQTYYSKGLRNSLAVAHLKKAFGKSWIIQKAVKPMVKYLSKILSKGTFRK